MVKNEQGELQKKYLIKYQLSKKPSNWPQLHEDKVI